MDALVEERTRDQRAWLIAVRQPEKWASSVEGLNARTKGKRTEFKGVSSDGQKNAKKLKMNFSWNGAWVYKDSPLPLSYPLGLLISSQSLLHSEVPLILSNSHLRWHLRLVVFTKDLMLLLTFVSLISFVDLFVNTNKWHMLKFVSLKLEMKLFFSFSELLIDINED